MFSPRHRGSISRILLIALFLFLLVIFMFTNPQLVDETLLDGSVCAALKVVAEITSRDFVDCIDYIVSRASKIGLCRNGKFGRYHQIIDGVAYPLYGDEHRKAVSNPDGYLWVASSEFRGIDESIPEPKNDNGVTRELRPRR